MSKEYKAYRFFVMMYVLVIANFAVLLSERTSYYIWFGSSILLLFGLLIYEKGKLLDLMRHSTTYKLSQHSIFLIAFIITYPRHYQQYRHLDYGYVVLLQIVNVLLFAIVFCVKKKSLKPENI